MGNDRSLLRHYQVYFDDAGNAWINGSYRDVTVTAGAAQELPAA